MRPPLRLPDKQERKEYMKETCMAAIAKAVIEFDDYGRLQFELWLQGWRENQHFTKIVTGYPLGRGHVGATIFEGDARGVVALMRIMDVVGVSSWDWLENKAVRILEDEMNGGIHTIGNATKDKWLDLHEIFFPHAVKRRADFQFGEADPETREI